MNKFVRNLITEWRRLSLPIKDATVIVAVSGGADSVSLLLAIDELQKRKKLDLRVVAAHFDHKLRGIGGKDDLDFVRLLTTERKIELSAGEWKERPSGNIEQNARLARYDFLRKTAENVRSDIVLTGHTMNDQAETVLMNLVRGSGPKGLSGMRIKRSLAEADLTDEHGPMLPFAESSIDLVRPMLRWATRTDTETFCFEHEIDFRIDPMNEDTTFRRVWVRKILLPMLEEVNPKIVATLCRTADLLAHSRMSTETASEAISTETDILRLKELTAMPQALLYETLRKWLLYERGDLRGIQLKHIEAIERLIRSCKSGKRIEIPGGSEVLKENGRLVYANLKVDKKPFGN